MNNSLIQIEKGKYTALLRRVLGMQLSENGVPELQALLTTISRVSEGINHTYVYGGNRQEIENGLENIGFALEYYDLCKEDFYGPDVKEQEYPKVLGKIDLRKAHEEDTFGGCNP
jgi:hypothetical protein